MISRPVWSPDSRPARPQARWKLVDERAGDANALWRCPPKARSGGGASVRRARPGEHLAGPLPPIALGTARVDQGQLHVVERVRPGEQIEGLEDESDS